MNKNIYYLLGAVGLLYLLTKKKRNGATIGSSDGSGEFYEFNVPTYATKFLTKGDDKGLTIKEKNAITDFKRYVAAEFGNTNFTIVEKNQKDNISDIANLPSKGKVDVLQVEFT